MSPELEQDNVLRVSISPKPDGSGFVVMTAYRGWRYAEQTAGGTPQDLIDLVDASLARVLSADERGNARVTLGPDSP
jgi:hypothetical protein